MTNPYLQEATAARFSYRSREGLVARYSWAIPNDEALDALVAVRKPFVEIGAGNGYWASLLAQRGVSVECHDRDPGKHIHGSTSKLWHPVAEGGPGNITDAHRDHALLLVWPPYDDPMATDALLQYMKAGGTTVAYVGEGNWGCTGDDEYHRILDAHWHLSECIPLPVWQGIHDNLYLYGR